MDESSKKKRPKKKAKDKVNVKSHVHGARVDGACSNDPAFSARKTAARNTAGVRQSESPMELKKIEMSERQKALCQIPRASAVHEGAVSRSVERVVKDRGLTAGDIALRADVVNRLQAFLRKFIGEVKLQMFGSSLSGCGLKGSDVNIYVSGAVPGPSILVDVFKVLRRHEVADYVNVRSDFNGKVPSVMLEESNSGLGMVIVIDHASAVLTSHLLHAYTLCDPRLTSLTIMLRSWAKMCGLDRQEKGTLPAYAYDLMVVHFLQQSSPSVLPVLPLPETQNRVKGTIPKKMEDRVDFDKLASKAKSWSSDNASSVGQLWLQLLNFYCFQFDFSALAVSLRSQEPLLRETKGWLSKMIAIEDPFFVKQNIAKTLCNYKLYNKQWLQAFEYFAMPRDKHGTPLISEEQLKQLAEEDAKKELHQHESSCDRKTDSVANARQEQEQEQDSLSNLKSGSVSVCDDSIDRGEFTFHNVSDTGSVSTCDDSVDRSEVSFHNVSDTGSVSACDDSVDKSEVPFHNVPETSSVSACDDSVDKSEVTFHNVPETSSVSACDDSVDNVSESLLTPPSVSDDISQNGPALIGSAEISQEHDISDGMLMSPSENVNQNALGLTSVAESFLNHDLSDSLFMSPSENVNQNTLTLSSVGESSHNHELSDSLLMSPSSLSDVSQNSSSSFISLPQISHEHDISEEETQVDICKVPDRDQNISSQVRISQISHQPNTLEERIPLSTCVQIKHDFQKSLQPEQNLKVDQSQYAVKLVKETENGLKAVHVSDPATCLEENEKDLERLELSDAEKAEEKSAVFSEDQIASLQQMEPEEMFSYELSALASVLGQEHCVVCEACGLLGHDKACCANKKTVPVKLPSPSPQHLALVDTIITNILVDFKSSESDLAERDLLLQRVQSCIQHRFPDAVCQLFGSSKNGFGFFSSDLDISLCFQGKSVKDVEVVRTIRRVADVLVMTGEFDKVAPIVTAKVPIVKFTHSTTQLEGDISLYNLLALRNTALLRTYASIDQRVQVLGYAVKVFAKACDIGDASRGSLSSYAYILMMLHYLQQCRPPVIPVLQELDTERKETADPDQYVVEGCDTWFYDDLPTLAEVWTGHGKNTQSVGELWLGFLHYYTAVFDWKGTVVCIRQSDILTKFEKMWKAKSLAVEDPFELSHNLGRGLVGWASDCIFQSFCSAAVHFSTPVDENMKEYQKFGNPAGHFQDYFFENHFLTRGVKQHPQCAACGKLGHTFVLCPLKPWVRQKGPRPNHWKKNKKAQFSDNPSKNSSKSNAAGKVQKTKATSKDHKSNSSKEKLKKATTGDRTQGEKIITSAEKKATTVERIQADKSTKKLKKAATVDCTPAEKSDNSAERKRATTVNRTQAEKTITSVEDLKKQASEMLNHEGKHSTGACATGLNRCDMSGNAKEGATKQEDRPHNDQTKVKGDKVKGSSAKHGKGKASTMSKSETLSVKPGKCETASVKHCKGATFSFPVWKPFLE